MSDEQGRVRRLVERAIDAEFIRRTAYGLDRERYDMASLDQDDIRAEADALDAIMEREPDELLQRAIESNRKVLEMMAKPIPTSKWPEGEAARELAEAMLHVRYAGVRLWETTPEWVQEIRVREAAAVLARLRAGEGEVQP